MKIECNSNSGRARRFGKYQRRKKNVKRRKKSLNYLLSTIWDIRRESNGCLHTYTARNTKLKQRCEIQIEKPEFCLFGRDKRAEESEREKQAKKMGIFVCAFWILDMDMIRISTAFFLPRHSFDSLGENGTAFSRQKW